MAKHILFCENCSIFTMREICKCGEKAVTVAPAKYSPDDKYAGYKRQAKREGLEKEGLL